MTRLDYDNKLTRDENIASRIAITHKGMAHFAGTGPKGRTCRECINWLGGDYYRSGGRLLKPASCAEFKRRMNGKEGPKVPHNASACNCFAPSENPPKIAGRA